MLTEEKSICILRISTNSVSSQISKVKRLQRHLSGRQCANQHLIKQLNCLCNGKKTHILTRETVQVNLNQLIHPITILQALLNHITTDPKTMLNFVVLSSSPFEMASLLFSLLGPL